MNNSQRIVVYGVAIWALPFVIGMMLFSIQASHADIFDTIMKLVLLLAVLIFSTKYLSRTEESSLKHLVNVGFIWAAICLAIDVPLFVFVFGWSIHQYAQDVPLGYLLIPLATGGMAKAYGIGANAQ